MSIPTHRKRKRERQATKKGQIYFTDYMIAILIFALFTTMYFVFEPNLVDNTGHDKELLLEAKAISTSLLSKGIPNNWTEYDVIRVGLKNDDQSINETKLIRFFNATDLRYDEIRSLLNVKNEFMVYMLNQNGDRIKVDVGGTMMNETGNFSLDAKKVSKITRIVAYNNSLNELVVITWNKKN
jgi:hypothetical protein